MNDEMKPLPVDNNTNTKTTNNRTLFSHNNVFKLNSLWGHAQMKSNETNTHQIIFVLECIYLCNSCSNYTHSHFRHQFHADTSLRIRTLEVVNKLHTRKKK